MIQCIVAIMLLMTGFVLQGHIYECEVFLKITLPVESSEIMFLVVLKE